MAIMLTVNGVRRDIAADPATPLLWVLRDHLTLLGTKFGCGAGLCGACTVHLNGNAIRSCVTTLASVAGQRVTTIEGLSSDGSDPLETAWEDVDVPQSAYCRAASHHDRGITPRTLAATMPAAHVLRIKGAVRIFDMDLLLAAQSLLFTHATICC